MNVQFFQPQTMQEAVDLLRRHAPEARPLAGGTDLVVHARGGRGSLPGTLVHLGGIPGLNAIVVDESGSLRIGAMASHGEVERSDAIRRCWTALSDASAIVGSPATRHVGTIGGNLCNGSPAMEIGGPLLVFDAVLRLVGPGGERLLPLAEFFMGPGRTACGQDEMLAEVLVPPLEAPAGGATGSAYLRLEFRKAMEIAIAGVAAALALDAQGAIAECRLALTAVAPVIVRVPEAEAALRGQVPGDRMWRRAAELAMTACSPIDDVRSPAAYRRQMIGVYTRRVLDLALERCR
jgi:CO/xanthine dehydrogenase FAD-binding subunit